MYFLADIGGTKTRTALSLGSEGFDEPTILPTPASYADGLGLLSQLAGRADEPLASAYIGLPVLLSDDKRSIIDATNLPDWSGKPFADDLEKLLNTRVYLENDTAQVGMGEAVHGAGKGARTIAYFTVSTGVNGARIQDGKLDAGNVGCSVGRQYVSMDGSGTWEQKISGRAISDRFGKAPQDIAKNDPLWEELAGIVAFGIHNAVLFWRPDRVVLGGSMFNEIGISVASVAEHVRKIECSGAHSPDIVHASLGDLGGLWGALALLRARES
ncbi:MAG TPA: ROK family protein [Candidatus Paceibacterota bacterium]